MTCAISTDPCVTSGLYNMKHNLSPNNFHRLKPIVEPKMSGSEGVRNEKRLDTGGSGSSRSPVDLIREEMLLEGLDAYIIGCADSHQSEFVCDRDRRLAFIT